MLVCNLPVFRFSILSFLASVVSPLPVLKCFIAAGFPSHLVKHLLILFSKVAT